MKTNQNLKPLKGKINQNNINVFSLDNVDIIGNPGSSMDSINFEGNGVISSSTDSIILSSPVGITSEYFLGERINMTSIFKTISSDITTSFINISSGTPLSGSLSNSNFDFFVKTILITGCTLNSSLILHFPTGNLTTPDNNIAAKDLTLNASGQGITLIWDSVNTTWYLQDAGVYKVTLV